MAARPQLVEVTLLVLAAEFGGTGQQLVGDRDGRAPAEAGIERAQQRVLAARGGGEVGCAVDDSIVGDEHSPTVGVATDTRWRAKPVYFVRRPGCR